MKKLPHISEAEYQVMKIIWKYAPISTTEVIEKLVETSTWSPKTIQTMLLRLVKKGALTYEKIAEYSFILHLLKKKNT